MVDDSVRWNSSAWGMGWIMSMLSWTMEDSMIRFQSHSRIFIYRWRTSKNNTFISTYNHWILCPSCWMISFCLSVRLGVEENSMENCFLIPAHTLCSWGWSDKKIAAALDKLVRNWYARFNFAWKPWSVEIHAVHRDWGSPHWKHLENRS